MKVTTDACVFGGYVVQLIQHVGFRPSRILDVGTGSGLLSLMLAQQLKPPFQVQAIDISEAAYQQAADNFRQSPWSAYLQAIHANACIWRAESPYDLVICNPPFYQRALPAQQKERTWAFHETLMTLDDVFRLAHRCLNDCGWLALLLPIERMRAAQQEACIYGLQLISACLMQAKAVCSPHVAALIFSRDRVSLPHYHIVYQEATGDYSLLFRQWLAPYYLYF